MKISIIVPVYNSGSFLKEALDSCLRQQYQNLELIISDDGSQDNSVEIAEKWLEENQNSFVRVKLVQQEKNLGVRDNTNFLINEADGEYIKLLEGDDILVDGAIKKLHDFVVSDPEIKFVFSDLLIFNDDPKENKIERPTSEDFKSADASKQYRMLLYGQKANGPSVFFHKKTICEFGAYIGARNCADWPTLIQLCKNGIKAHHFPEPLLYYRKHDSNISDKNKQSWKAPAFEMKKIRNEFLLKEDLTWKDKLYCYQDILMAKKEFEGKLSFKESVSAFWARKLYRLLK